MAGEARVPFVGLTGGIAAGKSEALSALERVGAATLSSDAVVHELLTTGDVRDALVERFGDQVAPGGDVDRSAVAEVVFGDPDKRQWLEGLLWPRVGERIASWREQVEHADPRPRAAVVEVPLLFESGMEAVFDRTIAVVADEELRNERAGARGHRGVESRTSRQLSQDEKAQRADIVVRNDGTLDDLQRALSSALGTMEP
ncbi:MAG: dephospho-CoA kinase [Thermoleophilaceae bacterium]|nr:dephospho-CoA kinase [Thermoleophilaceae bacterium]MEA2430095.1 dephospho-CoA kinase [Thermoleophilaceae bacterium]MEA2437146.1 dephospho-CoA kinase [Thermoleophilaceae bacterium]